MFTGLEITDILGSRNINNDTPLLVVSYKNMNKCLDKIHKINNKCVFRVNSKKLNSVLNKFYQGNVDISHFCPVGDYCANGNCNINHIVLANKYLVPASKNYKPAGALGGLYFWYAYLRRKGKESRSMGIVVTKTAEPPSYRIPVLPRSFFVKMDFGDSVITGNEFNVLNFKDDGLWMLVRSKFNRSISNFKLLGLDGKYLSAYNKKLELRDRNTSNQDVTYNAQGELIMNGMCITNNNGTDVSLDKCSNKKNQKWVPYNGNFISLLDDKYQTCLSVDEKTKSKVKTKKCNLKSASEWDMQDTDGADSRNYGWGTVKGKSVALVNKCSPWYLNEDIVGERKYIHVDGELLPSNAHSNIARYAQQCAHDPTGPNWGRGYSYADIGKGCKKIGSEQTVEGFGSPEQSDNYGMFILLVIFIILVLMRYNHKL